MSRPLVLACGALVAELRAVLAEQGLSDAADIRYLPANLHNRPEQIVPALKVELAVGTGMRGVDGGSGANGSEDEQFDTDRSVLIGYADCGTGGLLDAWIDELHETMPNVVRLPGAHCYEFFAGTEVFAALHDEAPGTFYLTDFLARHFDALVWQGLGLDRHPQLLEMYFGNYTRLVLLSQSMDDTVVAAGRAAADQLGLAFEHRHVGRSGLAEPVIVSLTRKAA